MMFLTWTVAVYNGNATSLHRTIIISKWTESEGLSGIPLLNQNRTFSTRDQHSRHEQGYKSAFAESGHIGAFTPTIRSRADQAEVSPSHRPDVPRRIDPSSAPRSSLVFKTVRWERIIQCPVAGPKSRFETLQFPNGHLKTLPITATTFDSFLPTPCCLLRLHRPYNHTSGSDGGQIPVRQWLRHFILPASHPERVARPISDGPQCATAGSPFRTIDWWISKAVSIYRNPPKV
jgi:hypothetical protein